MGYRHLLVPERLIRMCVERDLFLEIFIRHNSHLEEVRGQRYWVGDLVGLGGEPGVTSVYSGPHIKEEKYVDDPQEQ